MSTDDTSYPVEGRADGFTPVFDQVVNDLGTTAALVFGVIWRHCQMRRGVCEASKETLARLVGMHRRTVMSHVAELCQNGYLVDLTPNRRNAPHVYQDAGKVQLVLSVHAELSTGVIEDHTSHTERCDRGSHLGVIEDHTRILRGNKEEGVVGDDHDQDHQTSRQALVEIGVEAGIAGELVRSCQVDQVMGWCAYAARASGLRDPPALVVARLRAGAPAPSPPARAESSMVTCPCCHRLKHVNDLCPDCGRCYYDCHDADGACLPG